MNLREKISHLTRNRVILLLEDAGIVCYDYESKEVLAEALAVNVEDGTIDETSIDDMID